MATTPTLYDTLWTIFAQHRHVWGDVRRLKTFLWMMVGVIMESSVHMPDWAPYVVSRAQKAASTVRRFGRWFQNEHIDVARIWRPYVRAILEDWEGRLVLILDTTTLWGRFCWVRVSIPYRGRALPIAWCVLAHRSTRVSFEIYRQVLERAATMLPPHLEVVLLADRGFADRALIRWLRVQGWHWRLRIKRSFRIYRPRHGWRTVKALTPPVGRALCLHGIYLGAQKELGPLYLAVGQPLAAQGPWYILSDEPTGPATFEEYAQRMHIEASILDDKSNGFRVESSYLQDPQALERLGLVLAAVTFFLVAQGVQVVAAQQRGLVDPHWFRGASYLKIGWRYVKRALLYHQPLLQRLCLPGGPDPEPAKASRPQHARRHLPQFFRWKIVHA